MYEVAIPHVGEWLRCMQGLNWAGAIQGCPSLDIPLSVKHDTYAVYSDNGLRDLMGRRINSTPLLITFCMSCQVF